MISTMTRTYRNTAEMVGFTSRRTLACHHSQVLVYQHHITYKLLTYPIYQQEDYNSVYTCYIHVLLQASGYLTTPVYWESF